MDVNVTCFFKQSFKQIIKQKKLMLVTGMMTTLMVLPEIASAVATPTAVENGVNPLGYDIYDVAVNDILNGPVGFVSGVAAIVVGGAQLFKSWQIALLSVLGGSAILNADTIVTTMGALV